ncbi:MAG TPA: EAL domain-containing protein [Xanthobacteraceae bacterium]|nr:EAL domain-containing protein [Xanthobacteraceae bacterium]
MSRWLRAFRQTTTYLGVAVIAIVWGGIYLLASKEHERAYQDAVRQGNNLTRVFEEYVRSVVRETDGALLALRRTYQHDPQNFDIVAWAADTQHSDLFVQYGITGADGLVKKSTQRRLTTPVYVGDRPHFLSQVDDTTDQLYISPPTIGRVSHKGTIHFSRRLSKPDGSFDGVVVTSLDVEQLEKFFGSLDIGRGGVVSLVGLDGIVRARGGGASSPQNFAGLSIVNSPLFPALRQALAGSYWNTSNSSAKFDNIIRLISYRTVTGIPLVAVVGLTRDGIFQHADDTLRHYVLAGTILTAIVLVVMALGAAGRARVLFANAELQHSKQSIEQSNLLLHTALTNMAHGLSMFNRDMRLVMCNDRYIEMYGMSPDLVKPGTTLRAILESRFHACQSPEEAERFIREKLDNVVTGKTRNTESVLNDGRAIAVNFQPMADGGWVAIHHDITERKNTERALLESTEALKKSNARFAAALQNMSQGLCMFDAEQRILVANKRYRQIYNLPEDLVKPGTTLGQIVEYRITSGNYSGPDPAEYIAAQLRDTTDMEKLGNGRVVMILRHAMADGCWLTTHEDITERWRTETRVAYLAHHDALTGLANRPSLVDKIEDACSRYRWRGEEFSVLMVDLDRFKQVNDTFGHPSGDELLKQVADRLKGALRETDILARLGGDEFAIIQVSDAGQVEAAEALAAKILALIAEPFCVGAIDVGICASIGIALAPEHGTRADDLLKKADLALYHAKSSGRNRYAIFESALGQAAVEKHTLENELRRALARNEFEIHFQPIVDTKTLKMHGAEALIRWRHPERGLIPPDQFIPLAEESGTILQIGEWVLEAACKEAVKWPSSVKVAVNLSAVQLRSASLLDYIMCVLVETGLPPERLELEVTETALIEHGADCVALLRRLKNLGITVALDDFGTGYSSPNQLTMFPFDKIKIDKSFTKGMTNRTDCAAIISAVLALAHSLNIQTTAEGVETEQQLSILRVAGVSTVQGYLIQRPGPASQLNFDGYLIDGVVSDAA